MLIINIIVFLILKSLWIPQILVGLAGTPYWTFSLCDNLASSYSTRQYPQEPHLPSNFIDTLTL